MKPASMPRIKAKFNKSIAKAKQKPASISKHAKILGKLGGRPKEDFRYTKST